MEVIVTEHTILTEYLAKSSDIYALVICHQEVIHEVLQVLKKKKTSFVLFLGSEQKGIKKAGNTVQGMIKFQKDVTKNILTETFQKLFI